MVNEKLKAALKVDISLLNTPLNALFTTDDTATRILVIPDLQEDTPGVTIQQLIDDLNKIAEKAGAGKVDEDELKRAMEDAVKNAGSDNKPAEGVNAIKICLRMAYLYIVKSADESKEPGLFEYAINVKVLTDGLIPASIREIVNVTGLSVAVWNTERKPILEKMTIAKVEDYLGLPASETSGN